VDIDKLRRQIKRNCDVSDARFWGFYSICGMLMRIRQLYMHEHALMPWDAVPNELILPWISEREARWDRMEDEQFGNIQIDGVEYTPFDVEGINARLNPHGLLYGAGLGLHPKEPVTDDFPARFTALAADVSKILISHEAAEFAEDAGAHTWLEILDSSNGRFTEIYVRAMKDLLADTSQAGPLRHIIDTQDKSLLAFYVALLDNARVELFPEITAAYEELSKTGSWQSIEHARGTACARAKKFRQDTLSLWKTHPNADVIEAHIKSFLKNSGDALYGAHRL
jgi:hypothetical protein